jgi:hypothetical protein
MDIMPLCMEQDTECCAVQLEAEFIICGDINMDFLT